MKKVSIYDCNILVPYKVFNLLQVNERQEYIDGKPTGKKVGYTVTVVAHDSKENLELAVKTTTIEGLTESSVKNFSSVQFENLSLRPYHSNGRVELSASADKVIIVDRK